MRYYCTIQINFIAPFRRRVKQYFYDGLIKSKIQSCFTLLQRHGNNRETSPDGLFFSEIVRR